MKSPVHCQYLPNVDYHATLIAVEMHPVFEIKTHDHREATCRWLSLAASLTQKLLCLSKVDKMLRTIVTVVTTDFTEGT